MALIVVTGSPGCGKSTWVRRTARPGDIRFDTDALTNLISGRDEDKHHHDKTVRKISTAARDAGIREALQHRRELDVYILTSNLNPRDADKYRRLGAHLIIIDPGYDVAMARCRSSRPGYKHRLVDKWYDRRDQWPVDAQIINTNDDTTTTATCDHDEPDNVPKQVTGARRGSGRRKSTTERGYGHTHQKRRELLLARHVDGTPCSWCNGPMYRDAEKNFDSAGLEAEHSKSLHHHGMNPADELMHRRCNRQKREGGDEREHLRPTTGPPGFDWAALS